MNGLTVNLHLLLATFYRPIGRRRLVLVDGPCFPSDRYAVETQIRWRGLDPDRCLLEIGPRDGEACVREEDLEAALQERGDEVALVLLGAVNFHTGQRLEVARLADATRRAGATLGLDLAHAAGNVPLHLHDWDVDFAVWCTYKYLNAGPGAPGGAFVHERHGRDVELGRLGGWWGNDPETRFRMQLLPGFAPRPDALGWQISCPPVLAFAPLGPALALFDEVGFEAAREKSRTLTGYLEALLRELAGEAAEILTPADPERRGCQLSLRIPREARALPERLAATGVLADFREPDVVRLAPAPLFNSYHDAWRAATAVAAALGDG
jgi:kynureninase